MSAHRIFIASVIAGACLFHAGASRADDDDHGRGVKEWLEKSRDRAQLPSGVELRGSRDLGWDAQGNEYLALADGRALRKPQGKFAGSVVIPLAQVPANLDKNGPKRPLGFGDRKEGGDRDRPTTGGDKRSGDGRATGPGASTGTGAGKDKQGGDGKAAGPGNANRDRQGPDGRPSGPGDTNRDRQGADGRSPGSTSGANGNKGADKSGNKTGPGDTNRDRQGADGRSPGSTSGNKSSASGNKGPSGGSVGPQ